MPQRFLVIGCGSIGRRHALNLQALNNAAIWVYDPNFPRMQSLAAEYHFETCPSLEEAWAAQPNAALICAPTRFHFQLSREALLHGCDVFVEKPLADREEELDELIELVGRRGAVAMVGHNLRYKPAFVQVQKWIQAGAIGRVLSAQFHYGSYLPARHPSEDYRQGYAARPELGGGVILDAIHEIDAVQLVMGTPERVFCSAGQVSSLEIGTEDLAEMIMSYPDARCATVHLDYLQRPHQRWCQFTGEDGLIYCDLACGTARLSVAGRNQWTEFNPGAELNDEYRAELQEFLDCLTSRRKPAVDAVEGAHAVRLALRLKQSAAERRPLVFTAAHAAQLGRN